MNDLKPLVAGQGQNWIDAQILRANGLQVVTAASTASLIKMLTQHRFDYFPWGAMEIVPELSPYFANQVDIEQKIIISYPSITVLYVKPDAQQLAARLEHGLKNLFANGNFDRLFFSHPTIKSVLNTLKLDKRRIMQLCNPLMVEWVPTGVDTYWLFPWSEHIRGSECKAKFLPAQ